ncbi:MAG: dihydroorotate dehydrogenase electron transfer subunit [Eubacterium sp.]|nr:dihydroorotate dehydrogenase electron transfer subunit [Eubacterium sp.]
MIKVDAKIIDQIHLIEDIYSLTIECPEIVKDAHSGQFVNLYTNDPSKLLPRPISICDLDKKNGFLRMVYRTAGEGTKQISKLTAGDVISVTGPVGNGYDLNSEKPILMGGGIGIPPMLRLAKELSEKGLKKEDITVILGYRDATFLLEEFEEVATVYISSDTGSVGIKGNVIDAAKHYSLTGDMIYACGPKPMLRAIQGFSAETGISAQISLEERMACGIGACLACVTKTTSVDDHSKVKNARICVDGPVFYAEEVEL